MKTKGRVPLYTPIDWTRKFAQFPSTRRHIPRLPWPRLWRFNRLVHFMAHLLFVTATTMATTPVRAQRVPAEPHVVPASASPMRAGRAADPLITITAKRDTIIAGLEGVVLTLAREEAVQDSLTVTVNLTQEQEWIQILPYTVTFAAGQATAVHSIVLKGSAGNLQSGDVVAAVGAVAGYATDDATATVHVIALGGPAATAFVEQPNYSFTENTADTRATVVARMASGMPRGADVRFTVAAFDGSAGFEDYEQILRPVTLREEDYVELNGRWEARRRIRLRLLDDDVREGVEYLRFLTALSSGDSPGVVIGDSSGAPCPDCIARVEITDDEDIPTGDLRPSEEEIREEDESSSTASVVITNGKSFATDRVVTFTLGGTATEGTDYVVTSGDADDGTPGYQVALPAGSTRAGVTLRAMDDQIDDPGEQIQVSAVLDGSAFGEPAAIRIVNRRLVLPKIKLTAERDTIIAGLEELLLTATLEEPAEENLQVTVHLTQEQNWVRNTSYQLNVLAGRRIYELELHESVFSSAVTESGTITATVDSVDGYDTSDATASVFVVSREGPVVGISLSYSSYLFAEDDEDTDLIVLAQMASGIPRGVTVAARVKSRGNSSSRPELTATSGSDYGAFDETLTLREQDYALENGLWVARHHLPVTLLDDDVREDRERFQAVLNHAPGHRDEIRLLNPDTTECLQGGCPYLVFIVDDEDIPELDLSVDLEQIWEEDEASSNATVSITNGKTFSTDQVVTLAFAGTASEDADYHVTPADADEATSDHQVILSAGSTSVDVTFTTLDDDIEDSNESIEISATHDGEAIGSIQTIRILNQEVMPSITLAAKRDTIIAGLEDLVLTATREAPLDQALTVTVQLTQEQSWLSSASVRLNFPADGATSTFTAHASAFSSRVTQSGTITAVMDSVAGYDTGDATATVYVVSQEGPAMKVFFSHEVYRFNEDREDPFVILIAEAAVGMPRAATVDVSVSSRSGTAQSPADYAPLSVPITVPEEDFAFENGLWQTQYQLPLPLMDDDVREGTESFDLLLERAPSTPVEVQFSDYLGLPCQGDCLTPVEITDGEDIPELGLSVSEDEIREKGETSSTATVSITNGKTFATDQAVTLQLGGDAIPGHDYHVAPADADETTADHQVTLPAGSNSVEVMFTARDDAREEPTEEIRLSVTHDGNAIGNRTIRIKDRFPGPRVEITFEGVQPPRDQYDAGIATGPFTTRITFSEQVEGFTQEDIDWQTHSLTTVDTTNIAVLLWDYTEVRAGLEYTVRMMPDQNGRLHIVVFPDSARSVATGDGSQLGHGSLQVELPKNRMMVEPRSLTVDEGDADGAQFVVLLTSEPTSKVTVTVSGMEGTDVAVNWPDLTFQLPYWSGGWGVRVMAGADADTRDETVTLTVTASGGGYGGKTANVVVTVRDTGAGAASASDSDGEHDLVALVADVTPEVAAAALFGNEGLSDAQLDALDLLGNRNGIYDLGDLLSWLARCERGEASCGGTSLPAGESTSGAGAILAAAGRGGRTRSKRRGRAGSAGRRRARNRRLRCRRAPARHGLALLLLSTLAWGCVGDEIVQPPIEQPDPGFLAVQLIPPSSNRDIGAMLVIEGPAIHSVQARGLELLQPDTSSSTRRQVVVSGALSAGPVLEFEVPDRGDLAKYQVRFLEVAGEDYTLRDLTAYRVVISR